MFQSEKIRGKNCIYAIEEPEGHLHSGAIHELRNTISNLTEESQVIVTTHSPIFVDRDALDSVVLVGGGKAQKPKKIDEVRSALGVRVSDNLSNAENVIFVEGETDKKIILKILQKNDKINTAIKNGRIVIKSMGGGAKVLYHANSARGDVVGFHFIVDHDKSGLEGVEKAKEVKLIEDNQVTFITFPSKQESEIEDLISPHIYKDQFHKEFGVDISSKSFKSISKWSDRMRVGFKASGAIFNDQVSQKAKYIISEIVKDCDDDPFLHVTSELRDAIIMRILLIANRP